MVTKSELRNAMRKIRKDGKTEEREMVALLKEHPLLGNAKRVFAFVPLPSEVDITPILDSFPIALPRCVEEGEMEFVEMEEDWRGGVKRGNLGVYEPTGSKIAVPDRDCVILVPGVAFDREGHRLGRGGGYYDRILSRYPDVPTIGICHSWQLVEGIPQEPHDRKVLHLLSGSWIR